MAHHVRFSLIITVASLLAWVLALLGTGLPWRELPITAIMIAAPLIFLVCYYAIKFYISTRLDAIYRSIDQAYSKKPDNVDMDQAAEQVADWAHAKQKEIIQLKEREKFRREFIGNLAHELKTPIFSIQGYILTLLEGGLEDEKVNRDFLGRAANGVERLNKIVEDLELITKLESGIVTVQMDRFDLAMLVTEIVNELEIHAKQRSLQLRNPLVGPIWVLGDRARIGQVITNLITNAINYGKEGGYCELRTFELGERLTVEVSDNGVGIPPEHLPRVFERFYRVDAGRSRQAGGSGLGLSICKHIIEAHKERITARSKPNEGTTFSFTLRRTK